MTSKEELETLKHKIIESFADVPHPQENIAPHECEECRDVRKTFAKLDWKTIKPEILEDNFGIIPLFSPEAFHYFLPAYLIYSLEHFAKGYDVCQFTIYAITPSNKDMNEIEMRTYWQDRFRGFTHEQMSCIYDFLDFILEDEHFVDFLKEAEKGKRNLKQFIEPILQN